MSDNPLTCRAIVAELDKYIVGQHAAKRAVALALRSRWRRARVPEPLRHEITPKNILMIGPTGVGKTEIARRLARLVQAPFVKIEATKFTEVGYVGKDVDTIIRDLVEVAVKEERERAIAAVREKAQAAAIERILDILLPPPRKEPEPTGLAALFANAADETAVPPPREESATRAKFREKLLQGALDDKEIEVEVREAALAAHVMGPPGMEEITEQLQGLFQAIGGKKKRRKMTIAQAKAALTEEEAAKLLDEEEIKRRAIANAEQNGIVFLDEIDKVAGSDGGRGPDVSRQGVQRDLLPLVEGTSVTTKYGTVRTDHILFIASGAFHLSKPSDLIPELQGRFPIRVELDPLTVDDFVHILTRTEANLITQYQALLATEGVTLTFTDAAVRRLAEIAWQVNERVENIGARRLYTVMEKLLEEIAFLAGTPECPNAVTIDAPDVDQRMSDLAQSEDLARYVL
ncbi:MAG TPA: ATP-dependent protease ATPase subunit HslU [Hydrogenophilus thermoluteolus]|nr:ATP-dependent protease ATPase subunit HslU [Hydrogenophilus thermoluteolus]